MTKMELVEKMSSEAGITKTAAGVALNAMIDSIVKTVKKGTKVSLVGFGTFSLSRRAARKGRNPRTGEAIKIKACKYPKFTAGKAFKDSVN